MNVPGQITFSGREVSGNKVQIPSLGEQDYIPLDGGDPEPTPGDVHEYRIRFVVDSVAYPERHDKDGQAIDTLKRVVVYKAIWSGLELISVTTREEMEQQWEKAQEA
jgi:hypothetical protein